MYYVPKFVKQVSDLEYGSVVTHENYNEKLNLNAEQGDYNTEVLRILFTERDINNTYRIPYLEKYTDDAVAKIQNEIDEHIEQIDKNTQGIKDNKALILNNAMDIDYIIDGRTPVALAKYANKVDGIDTAADHTYYGKDYDGKIGFHAVPDGIFAEDISSSTAEINGIYYVPRADSVEEYMLTSDVIAKLNRSSITAYPDLTDKPQINDVILIGKLTLNDLGIQPAGRYLTEVPEEYAKSVDIADTYLTKTDAATDYTPIGLYTDLKNSVDSLNDDINALPYNRVYIGEAPAEAKTGDLLVDL